MDTIADIFNWVVSSGVRASILVLFVLAAQFLLRRRLSARLRYAMWLPVLVVLLVPGIPMLPAPSAGDPKVEAVQKEILVAPVTQTSIARGETEPVRSESPETIPVDTIDPSVEPDPVAVSQDVTRVERDVPEIALPVEGPKTEISAPSRPSVEGLRIAACAWLSGAILAVLFVVISMFCVMRQIRRTALPPGSGVEARIKDLAGEIGLRRPPRILISPAVSSPSVCGVWRPVILINEQFFDEVTEEEAQMVLRHELAHIRRGDLWMNALACALLAIHWFNPVLWIAFLLYRIDREAACDAYVLRGEPSDVRSAYGRVLLKIETACVSPRYHLGFVGFLRAGSGLRARIESIINQRTPKPTMKIAIVLGIVSLSVMGLARAAKPADELLVSPDDSVPTGTAPISDEQLGDLRLVDRSIAKEPKYKTSEPKYGLILAGEEKPKRIWVVHDGSDVYIDCNGNGDLTEAGEKFPIDEYLVERIWQYSYFDLVECGAVPPEKFSKFTLKMRHDSQKWSVRAELKLDETGEDDLSYDSGRLRFRNSAEEAPIVPIATGLSVVPLMGHGTWYIYKADTELERGKEHHLRVYFGNLGLDNNSIVRCFSNELLKRFEGNPVEMRTTYQREDGSNGSDLTILPVPSPDEHDP